MPLPPGTKYRFKRQEGGKAVRLGILHGKVIEAVPFKKDKSGILKKKAKGKSLGR